MKQYLLGEVEFEEVHNAVASWQHLRPGIALNEYLGFTPAECTILIENESKFESYLFYLRNLLDERNTLTSVQ